MKRCQCDICQKETLEKDIYEKVAILDEDIFNNLKVQAQKIPNVETYINVKISMIKDKVELFEVCEECLSDKVFEYTDNLYKEHKMVLEPLVSSDVQRVSDVTLRDHVDHSSCYTCQKALSYEEGNDALYIKDAMFSAFKKEPKLLEKVSIDKVEELISQNTIVVNVCDNCMETEIEKRHKKLEEYGLLLSTEVPTQMNNGGNNNMNHQPEYEEDYENDYEDDDEDDEIETPTLDSYATHITSDDNIARIKKNRIFGRDKEVRSLINILAKADKNNPLIIGDSGVGKTSVVHKLAVDIYDGNVPSELFHKEIYEIKIADLVAGTKYRGDLENRMKALLSELKNRPDIIIFFDEIHQLIGAGGTSSDSIDVKDMIKPALSNGELNCIGVTTTNEYKKTIENDSALKRRFQVIQVKEPTVEETLQLLNNTKKKYEKHHGIKIKSELIEESIKLSKRYVTDRNLPDKAFDLIDQAGALLKVEKDTLAIQEYIERNKQLLNDIKYREFQNESEREELIKDLKNMNRTLGKDLVLDISYIHKVLKDWTGIEISKMTQSENDNLKDLSTTLKDKVIGQELATDVVSKYIKKAKVGLHSPNKPKGVYLLVGPTGTGKTELAKVTNDILGTNFIRFDLSEYSEKHEVSKLIGAPPGYIGYEEGGLLTEQVKRNPNSVILFDEIEKAHPDFKNILLQVCDEGILTDGRGNTVDFKNTMIFMTSNLIVDTNEVNKSIGFGSVTPSNVEKQTDNNKKKLLQSLNEKGLKKEFINRIDEVIMFNELTEEAIKKIAVQKLDLKVKEISLHNQYIDTLTYDINVVQFIIEKGYQKEYGARPINRAIESYVGDSLTDFLIEENVFTKRKKINCKITVKDNKVVVEKE